MISPLIVRAEAVQKTYDKFAEKPFVWGTCDCYHLVRDCLLNLGYAEPVGLRPYKTRLGAVRAMRHARIETVESKLDELFLQIAPAETLPGDILTIQSDDPAMPALGLRLSGSSILCFSIINGVAQCGIGPYTVADRAWRVY